MMIDSNSHPWEYPVTLLVKYSSAKFYQHWTSLCKEWGGEWGKQVDSMNEESQVRGCYNITFNYTNQEAV